ESHYTCSAYCLGHQIRRATHGHQIGRPMLTNRLNRYWPALCLSDHGDQTCLLEHHVRELVHAGRCRRPCRTHHLITHRINRPHVINDTVREVDRQLLATLQHLLNPLVGRIPTRQHLAREQQCLTWF